MRDHTTRPSRRDFCAAAGAGLLALSLPACDPGDPRLGVGGIDQTGGGGTGGNGTGGSGNSGSGGSGDGSGGAQDMASQPARDMAGQPPADLAGQSAPDLAQAPMCATTMVNAGASSSYTVGGTPKYFSSAKAFVVRDAGGLYAVSGICTHSGCTNIYQSGKFVCPCHNATFDLNGAHPTFPAPSGTLKHFVLCVDGSGAVWIDPKKTVDPSTRY
jgi:Rieske Fe-S protein